MKTSMKSALLPLALALAAALVVPRAGAAKIAAGQEAPAFSLKDLKGQTHDLKAAKGRPLLVLYFFDADSRPSQEGLLSLAQVAKGLKGEELSVWAITSSPADKTGKFASSAGLPFPVLLDPGAVADQYGARTILPTVCVVGPGLKVLDRFEGGGKAAESMLVRLAERKLQQRSTGAAKAIGVEVAKKNPKNAKARAVQGYAALKEKDVKKADEVFRSLSRESGEAEILGKEGLAAVEARKGQGDKALALAAEVEKKAPGRGYAQMIKGDVLLAQGKKEAAETEYRKAAGSQELEPYQQAAPLNQLGLLLASRGEYKKAQELYARAEEVDPFAVEGTTNRGVTYEKEGHWDKALETYRQALSVDKTDTFAAALVRRAEEMVALQKDAERSRRVDQLVKDLAARFREQKKAPAKEDTWTSGPLVLSFLDLQEKGALPERDGYSAVLVSELADKLNRSGRVKVVERALVAKLLEELNLGSSELANPETALKLGRILAARLLGTGTLLHGSSGSVLSLRLIDTETSAIPQVATLPLDSAAGFEKAVFDLNREILKTAIAQYPLRGFVARMDAGQALLNIGASQGVVAGTEFDVVEEGEAVPYKGKTLKGAAKVVARLRVARVEPDLSYAEFVRGDRQPKVDDRVQERMRETGGR